MASDDEPTRATERRLQESLSAAIDGEAAPLELRRVLNAVAEDADLLARWRSAHVIGSVIRGETPAAEAQPPQLDSASGNGPEATAPGRQWRWLGPVAGGAVAASAALAVVVVFGGRLAGTAVDLAAGDVRGAPVSAPAKPAPEQPQLADSSPALPPIAPSEQDVRRANAYLLQHARHAAVSARPAAMPFVKALAHDGRIRAVAAPPRND